MAAAFLRSETAVGTNCVAARRSLMRARLFQLMYDLRASYWFLPSIMAFSAIALGAFMVWLDAGPAAGFLDGLGWYQKAKPDGAHQVLSTIAGSMITVAGVVFSITIVAIAYAASQYGPRILTNFLSDRGNQVTLGTFIATFVYCLVVLRTIRGGDEGEFVPQLAVMLGLLLALSSIAVLIYFIHHVPNSIHINNVVARIGQQLLDSIDKRFPENIGDPAKGDQPEPIKSPAEQALAAGLHVAKIESPANGYIEAVDEETLMQTACAVDLVVRLHHVPGDYLIKGQLLVSAGPSDCVEHQTKRAIQRSYSIGSRRTPTQDIFFLVDELVEIAARALSTGVNDPYTAITCLDWFGAAAVKVSGRRMPSERRVDGEGTVRLIAVPQSIFEFFERGFGRMRQYLARDMNAALHALDTLRTVGVQCNGSDMKEALAIEARKLLSLAEQELKGPSLAQVRERYRETEAGLV